MKIIFHERFYDVYAREPAAAPGRMEAIVSALGQEMPFINAEPATEEDIALVHTNDHIARIKNSPDLYEISLLAVGAAIKASVLAMQGEPAFALLRPPGHHASPNSCWGFCYFNNIAIAIKKLFHKGLIKRALLLDIDLHFGDGTANSFSGFPEVDYFHPESSERKDFLAKIEKHLQKSSAIDILAVSAGFDRHQEDWGGLLTTDDYRTIGNLVKTYAQKFCHGRRFGVLEGGYNHQVLGQNVRAFLEGLKD
jgi:acetoin utilization deacetylase AcuC-like enzyme